MDAVRLARAFGLTGHAGLSDGPVERGRQGALWRLETDEGRWAVKVAFGVVDETAHERAAAFQEAASAAGVPTPVVRRAPGGSLFATVDGRRVRMHGWVELDPPDAGLDPALVGEVMARMHQVPSDDAGDRDAWFEEPVGTARWDDLVAALVAADAPFASTLAQLRDDLVELDGWVEPLGTTRMCHRDLWADNVRRTPDGGVCVIDWEDCGAADPSRELACVLFEFGRGDAGRARALVDAYEVAGGPGRIQGRGDFSMLVAQLGHIAEIAARDWLEPNRRSPDRGTAEAWVAELLDDPHTPAVLDALLAAVRGDAAG